MNTAPRLKLHAHKRCRVCGCTQADCRGCVERTGGPCHWVGPDLCSACQGPAVLLHTAAAHTARGLERLARSLSLRTDRGQRLSGAEQDELAARVGLYALALTRAIAESQEGGGR